MNSYSYKGELCDKIDFNMTPILVTDLIFEYLEFFDRIVFSILSSKLYSLYKDRITQGIERCFKCNYDALRSRQLYFGYNKILEKMTADNRYYNKFILPIVCKNTVCPCEYSRSYFMREIHPIMQVGDYIISLSSQTIHHNEIEHEGNADDNFIIMAIRYKSYWHRPVNVLCGLTPNGIMLIQETEWNESHTVVKRIKWKSYVQKIDDYERLNKFHPYDHTHLGSYISYLEGKYDEAVL